MSLLCRPNLFSRGLQEKREPSIVDLETIIQEAGWRGINIPSLCGCRKNPCKRKGLYLKPDWNLLERTDRVEDFTSVSGDVPLRSIQLYRTEFRNFSGEEQTFTFRAERQTTSVVEMTVQEGVSISGNFNLNFSLPEVSGGDSGGDDKGEKFSLSSALVGGQICWNRSVTDKYSKTENLKWGVDSAVKLPHGKRAVASLSVLEAKMDREIRIRTDVKIKTNSGRLPIDVVTKKDDEVISWVDVPVSSIIKGNKQLKPGDDNRSFFYYTTVLCKAVFGVEQIATVQLVSAEEGDVVLEAPLLQQGAMHALADRPYGGVKVEEIDCQSGTPLLGKA